jgi:hypothetical protein
VEPVAVGCIIRIFLRFVLEVEGLATKGFTKVQTGCYLKTLEVSQYSLCTLNLLSSCMYIMQPTVLFARFFNLIHGPLNLPQAILTQLLPSLKRVVSSCFFAEGVNNLHASPSVRASSSRFSPVLVRTHLLPY